MLGKFVLLYCHLTDNKYSRKVIPLKLHAVLVNGIGKALAAGFMDYIIIMPYGFALIAVKGLCSSHYYTVETPDAL